MMIRRVLLGVVLAMAAVSAQAATCYVEEYQQPSPATIVYTAAPAPGVARQTVAITSSSVQSNAFSKFTTLIRVHCDAIASVEVGGTNPTATATSARFAASQTEYFAVHPGDKLAVITNT